MLMKFTPIPGTCSPKDVRNEISTALRDKGWHVTHFDDLGIMLNVPDAKTQEELRLFIGRSHFQPQSGYMPPPPKPWETPPSAGHRLTRDEDVDGPYADANDSSY